MLFLIPIPLFSFGAAGGTRGSPTGAPWRTARPWGPTGCGRIIPVRPPCPGSARGPPEPQNTGIHPKSREYSRNLGKGAINACVCTGIVLGSNWDFPCGTPLNPKPQNSPQNPGNSTQNPNNIVKGGNKLVYVLGLNWDQTGIIPAGPP